MGSSGLEGGAALTVTRSRTLTPDSWPPFSQRVIRELGSYAAIDDQRLAGNE
jgi:hypothetical protein